VESARPFYLYTAFIDLNQVQTCKIFGCSERSLMRWVDKYKSTNHIILFDIIIILLYDNDYNNTNWWNRTTI